MPYCEDCVDLIAQEVLLESIASERTLRQKTLKAYDTGKMGACDECGKENVKLYDFM